MNRETTMNRLNKEIVELDNKISRNKIFFLVGIAETQKKLKETRKEMVVLLRRCEGLDSAKKRIHDDIMKLDLELESNCRRITEALKEQTELNRKRKEIFEVLTLLK